MFGWFNREARIQKKARAEELEADQGKLTKAWVDLEMKRHNVEQLMIRMLEERANGA